MPLVQILKGKQATALKVGRVECLLFKSGQKVVQYRGLFAMKVRQLPVFTANKNWSVKGKMFGWWYGKTTRPLKIKEIIDASHEVRGGGSRGNKGTTAHPCGRMLR